MVQVGEKISVSIPTGLRGPVVKSSDSYTLDLSTLRFEPRSGFM